MNQITTVQCEGCKKSIDKSTAVYSFSGYFKPPTSYPFCSSECMESWLNGFRNIN